MFEDSYIKSPEEIELEERTDFFISQCPFKHKKCEPQIVYKYHEMGGKVFVLQCTDCGRVHDAPIARSKLESIDYIRIDEIPLISNRLRFTYNQIMIKRSLERDEEDLIRERFREKLEKIIGQDKRDHLSNVLKVKWTNMDEMYDLYLASAHWEKKQSKIFIRDDYRCRVCGERASVVHHLSYKNLGQESDLELISLCGTCHSMAHNGSHQEE